MKTNPVLGIIIFFLICIFGSYFMEKEVTKMKQKNKITLDSLSNLDTFKKNKTIKSTAK